MSPTGRKEMFFIDKSNTIGAMRNIKMTVAYDGTSYHGFQEQRGTGLPTVQEKLESSLAELAGRNVQIIGSGRTDAGVHARGQVVNFNAAGWNIPAEKIALAVNGILPEDMAVLEAVEVPEDFHARFSATAKEYRYAIHNSRMPDPFLRRYSLFFPRPLDIDAIRRESGLLLGKHDFLAFKAEGSPVKTTIRTLYDIRIEQRGDIIYIFFRGDGFLYNMVRILVGTLLEIGLHKHPPGVLSDILASKDRTRAGPTAPPQGLCLMKVYYDCLF